MTWAGLRGCMAPGLYLYTGSGQMTTGIVCHHTCVGTLARLFDDKVCICLSETGGVEQIKMYMIKQAIG